MWRLSDDRGASLVLVAASMVALIALVGLAIDAGAIFAERRELSRGADAAVLAIAEDCASEFKPCDDSTAFATADSYADANADDGAAGIFSLDLDTDERRVTVKTFSESPEGVNELDLFFMAVVGIDSTTVSASASAVWGYPIAGSALPIIFSLCEFNGLPPPSEENPSEVTIYFHSAPNTSECAAQAGQDTDGDGMLPGGFGWLDTNECIAYVTNEDWVGEDPGASPSTGCSANELYSLLYDQTILIPFFDDVTGLGQSGEYHIAGLGAFHVTGYNFGGQYKAPNATEAPCFGDDRCIRGFYTRHVIYEGELGGGMNLGVIIVKLEA